MALISTIRKNGAWVLVVLIALGLIGFILQDMTVGQTSLFGSMQPAIGKVNGQKVDYNEFNKTLGILYANSAGDPNAQRSAVWDYFVEKALVDQEAERLGLGVSKEELMDLQFGQEVSPIIQQRFVDPSTQMLNREQLNGIKQQITGNTATPELRSYWAIQEREIIKDRLQTKMLNLVSKGMYMPGWVAEISQKESATMMNLAYVRVPFDAVDNSEVSISDEDYENYLKENKGQFKFINEARKVSYLAFDVLPTKKDSAEHRSKIAGLAREWRTAANDTLFVETNLGTIDGAYVKKEGLTPAFADSIFGLPVGATYGPYIDNGFYRAAKVLGRQVIPDSVRSRHILISPSATTPMNIARQRLDSIKTQIETGKTTFDAMARRFGQDGTAEKGGDLGFAGMNGMVKPFNDLIFFQAETGKLYLVETQFGMHLVEVTAKKAGKDTGIKVAYIGQAIVPSKATQTARYEEAQRFLNANNGNLDKFTAAAKKVKGATFETSPAVGAGDYVLGALAGTQTSRDIIKWAYTAKPGQVSKDIYTYQNNTEFYDSKYVLAALKTVFKPGYATADQLKEELQTLVTNRKKGELIASKLKGKGLEAAAGAYNVKVDTLTNTRFNQTFLPNNIGVEPRFNGYAFKLNTGQTSQPVIGTSGVYVIKAVTKTTPAVGGDLENLKKTLGANMRMQVGNFFMPALKRAAKIKDSRSKFF